METRFLKSFAPEELKKILMESLLSFSSDAELEFFKDWFEKRYGENLRAVVFFGSCLSELSKSPTSFKDFIVVVDKYRLSSKNPLRWLSHWLLPPDLFHLAEQRQGKKYECKYYIISAKQLLNATSAQAKDLYILGRLSKRIAVIYYREQESLELILTAHLNSIQKASQLSLSLLEQFDKEGFIKAVMRLSYLAETRLEDERKVESLYLAHSEFYKEVYGLILKELIEKGIVKEEGEDNFRVIGAKLPADRRQVEEFLVLSRKRFKARWPKMILTVDNWLDQLLAKLERTYGIKLEIPRWERPIILITGWRHYFRFKKEGKIHETKLKE